MVAKNQKIAHLKGNSLTGSNTPAMTHFVPSKAYVQVQITVIHIMPFPVTNVHVPVSGSKKRGMQVILYGLCDLWYKYLCIQLLLGLIVL